MNEPVYFGLCLLSVERDELSLVVSGHPGRGSEFEDDFSSSGFGLPGPLFFHSVETLI